MKRFEIGCLHCPVPIADFDALEEGQKRDAVGRPSWRSSLLGDPGEIFLCGKPNI